MQGKGWLSEAELSASAGWDARRSGECLEGLLKEGLAMVDDGAPDGVRLWWFPALQASGVGGGGGSGGGGGGGGAAMAAGGAAG